MLVRRAVLDKFASTFAEIRIPQERIRTFFFVAETLAEISIPVVARGTLLRHAFAAAGLFVPVVAWSTHLSPFAFATAALPVPEHVCRAWESVHTLAAACVVVPLLTLGTPVFLRAFAAALLEVKVVGFDALDLLLADALALDRIPNIRPLALLSEEARVDFNWDSN